MRSKTKNSKKKKKAKTKDNSPFKIRKGIKFILKRYSFLLLCNFKDPASNKKLPNDQQSNN